MAEPVIAERGPVGQVLLKGDPGALGAAVLAATGLALPGQRQAVLEGDRGALWLAPDETLLLCADAPALVAALTTALAGVHHLCLDMSDARTILRLHGPDAAEALAKGAPVDLRDAAFPIGALRRTHLGQIAVAFWRVGPQTYDLMCFRSVAAHVAAWLAVATRPGGRVGHL